MHIPLQDPDWYSQPPASNRVFRMYSFEELLIATQYPYFAWQGVNRQRAERELRRKKAKYGRDRT